MSDREAQIAALKLIEDHLKNGTKRQQAVALELLLRFLENDNAGTNLDHRV